MDWQNTLFAERRDEYGMLIENLKYSDSWDTEVRLGDIH